LIAPVYKGRAVPCILTLKIDQQEPERRMPLDKTGGGRYTEDCNSRPLFERRTTMTYFDYTAKNRTAAVNRERIVLTDIRR